MRLAKQSATFSSFYAAFCDRPHFPSRGLAHFNAQEADSVEDLFRVDDNPEAGRPTEGVRGSSSGPPDMNPKS